MAKDGLFAMKTRKKQAVILTGFPIGFFNPVIPTQNFVQSHNPEGFFFLASHLPSIPLIPNPSLFNIPNPEFQTREIPYPEKPVEDPLLSMTACLNFAVLWFLVNFNFLSRVDWLGFSLSAHASIRLTFDTTCTFDSRGKTPLSGLDLAQSVERFM